LRSPLIHAPTAGVRVEIDFKPANKNQIAVLS